ncbi:MAG: 16S rRNA (cytidine(1402)-2'-O)-methyltransferase [Pseudomonadota bacterium]|nr:16S rRNA (cytidine(1402)-2'-O)-methyltransferase [Pseudomonadota bacterium]
MNRIPRNKQLRKRNNLVEFDPKDGANSSKRISTDAVSGLYIVSTPIGNLGDISRRAVEVLNAAHLIACEDTRVTAKLIRAYGISTPMIAYHDHSSVAVRNSLLKKLRNGKTVALVSDAGTPLICDPGFKLVAAALDANISVSATPGPASPIMALVLSGLPTDRFFFGGYLPVKKKAQTDLFNELTNLRSTLIFLESPKRLQRTLASMLESLGDRPIAIARELTKIYEEIRRGLLSDLLPELKDKPMLKGEIIIVVGPAGSDSIDIGAIDTLLEAYLERMTVKDSVAAVVSETTASRKLVYSRALIVAGAR